MKYIPLKTAEKNEGFHEEMLKQAKERPGRLWQSMVQAPRKLKELSYD